MGCARERSELYICFYQCLVLNCYLRVFVKIIQVGVWFRGQRPLRVLHLRTVEASAISDRIFENDCLCLLALCVYSLLMDARMMCMLLLMNVRGMSMLFIHVCCCWLIHVYVG